MVNSLLLIAVTIETGRNSLVTIRANVLYPQIRILREGGTVTPGTRHQKRLHNTTPGLSHSRLGVAEAGVTGVAEDEEDSLDQSQRGTHTDRYLVWIESHGTSIGFE